MGTDSGGWPGTAAAAHCSPGVSVVGSLRVEEKLASGGRKGERCGMLPVDSTPHFSALNEQVCTALFMTVNTHGKYWKYNV